MITGEQVDAWLDAYGRAWERQDNSRVEEMYADGAIYQETPFGQVLRGRDAIRQYSFEAVGVQEAVKFGHEVLAVAGDTGIARVVVVSQGSLRSAGEAGWDLRARVRCRGSERLREWWHREESVP